MSKHRHLHLPKEWHPLADAALSSGWRIVRTNSDHLKWIPPVGKIIYSATTPSDRRAFFNCRSLLRQQGLSI